MPRADEITEIERDAEQRQAGDQEAGDGARLESELESIGERADRGLGGAHIGAHGDVHADEAGGARKHRADEEPERHQPAEEVREDEKDHDADDADRGVLALEIGLRAFAHRGRDLLHPRVARIRLEHGTSRPRGVDDGEHATKDDQPESRHCRNPGFVKRTGQEDLCTVAAAPSPIGRPKPRPKVARTLPKTVLRRNARKCPDLLNSSEFRATNGKKAAA